MTEQEHVHGPDCGCEHDEEETIITLTLDDDTEMDCVVLTIFPVKDKEYIALIPVEQEEAEAEERDVYLYRFWETPDGEPNLDNIEDDDEYEAVAEAFDALLEADAE